MYVSDTILKWVREVQTRSLHFRANAENIVPSYIDSTRYVHGKVSVFGAFNSVRRYRNHLDNTLSVFFCKKVSVGVYSINTNL